MDVSFPIPKELEAYVVAQLESGVYDTAADYFLSLLQKDCRRKAAQVKLDSLLQEGLDSEDEGVTADYWRALRISVLGTEQQEL